MSRAAKSTFIYACYLVVLSLTLFLLPDVALGLVGLPPHQDVWIRVVAMAVLFQAGYFFVAARHEVTEFFWLSVVFRLTVPFFFAAFVVLGFTTANILLLSPFDVLGALVTLAGLRAAPQRQAVVRA